MTARILATAAVATVLAGAVLGGPAIAGAQDAGIVVVGDALSVLPQRRQAILMNSLLKEKQETILPDVMRENGIDLWIVSEDDGPAYVSLLESQADGAVLETPEHLIFFDRGAAAGVERIEAETDELAAIVAARNPARIAIGARSGRRNRGGGGSPEALQRVTSALGEAFTSRIVSADTLANNWLGTRTPRELSIFKHVLRLAHEIIAEAYSNRVIVPDVTTTDDLNWWIRQRYVDLGIGTVDHPTITVQRSMADRALYDDDDEYFRIFDERFADDPSPRVGLNLIIRRGDVIFCDTGIMYLGLYTDTQQSAYVLREGEDEPPEGIKEALRRVVRFQDIIGEEMRLGRGGNEIGNAAVSRAAQEGIEARLYAHSLAYWFKRYAILGLFFSDVVHFAGSGLDSGRGDGPGEPLRYDTLFAMELHVRSPIPEWNGQPLFLFSETGMTFSRGGMVFPGGRETEWHVVR